MKRRGRPLERPPLQPQELQLVEGEVEDVEAVEVVDEVAHGGRRESVFRRGGKHLLIRTWLKVAGVKTAHI